TFRAEDGLWENHRVEDVATPEAFQRDPALVHRFYNARRARLFDDDVAPNAAHFALARLEQEYAGQVLLVTQNVDNLHERAGSQSLIHMHGELLKQRCESCGVIHEITGTSAIDSVCAACSSVGSLRPHIVWFGEMPLAMEQIYQALDNCRLFLSIGTSGHVYPAAGFVEAAAAAGAKTVELNLEPTRIYNAFDQHISGAASEIVPSFVQALLAEQNV
ncbi:MAG: Sir2 family NAD+-dependent deacetylase, partial [Pontibacterium sp.]